MLPTVEAAEVSTGLAIKSAFNTVSDFRAELVNTVQNFHGGKISLHLSEWNQLTSDPWILKTVTGALQELCDINVTGNTPHTLTLPAFEAAALEQALAEYADCHIIEPVDDSVDSFYSTLFPRFKSDGSVRVIFNLKAFNSRYVDHVHFKMDTIKDVLLMITRNCYFASIDFKHAYFSVAIAPQFRHMFRFRWHNACYQFTCLPQGFSPAPRIFTKLLKPVLAHLRSRGIQVICYIDDCIFVGQCPVQLRRDVVYALHLFDSLGLTVHPQKSVTDPVQQIEFLGFQLDSVTMNIMLTDKKKDKIFNLTTELLHNKRVTIFDLASLIGNLVAADPAVPLGPLRYKYLEMDRNRLLTTHKGNYQAEVTLDSRSLEMLHWWHDNIHSLQKPLITSPPTQEIFTDASMTGWGARMGSQSTGGQWAQAELAHINVLELKAVLLAIQTFCRTDSNIHVKIRSDNSTTVACINKAGSTKVALHDLTFELLTWTQERGIVVTAAHIPGVENVDADRESRRVNNDAEWQLKPGVFSKLCNTVKFRPTIDLFATRINAQLPTYVSWRPDPAAFDVDAFSMVWDALKPYCFPPFSVIGRVLQRIETANITALVILPLWPTKPWFVRALLMLAAPPLLLPRNCLQLPQELHRMHPLANRLRLAALTLSGNPCAVRTYRNTLSTTLCSPGARAPMNNIGITSASGCSFVSSGNVIHFAPL